MIFKTVKTPFLKQFFFCTTLCLYANKDIDKQINTILDAEQTGNIEKFNSIVAVIENNNALSELEKSQYYHDIARLFYKQYKALKVAITSVNKAVLIRRKYKETHLELLEKSLYNLGFFYKKEGAINSWYATYTEILKL